jgi:prevent-host-death family protein
MVKIYSTYEAKARLSEILERVRKGDVVTITHRGRPVAEVRPIEHRESSLAERIDDLRRVGIISRPAKRGAFKPIARRRGALRRFLNTRE